jgi:hypothetical protein
MRHSPHPYTSRRPLDSCEVNLGLLIKRQGLVEVIVSETWPNNAATFWYIYVYMQLIFQDKNVHCYHVKSSVTCFDYFFILAIFYYRIFDR